MKHKIGIDLIPFTSFAGSGNIVPFYLESLFEAGGCYVIFFNKRSKDIKEWSKQIQLKYGDVIFKPVSLPNSKIVSFLLRQLALPFLFCTNRIARMFTPTFVPIYLLFRKNAVIYYDAALYIFRRQKEYSFFSKLTFYLSVVYCKLFSIQVFALSDFSKQEYLSLYNISASPKTVKIISSAIPYDFKITSPEHEDEVMSALAIKKPYYFYVGASIYRKNLERMVNAFLIFSRQCDEEVYFILAGRSLTRDNFNQLFPQFAGNKNIISIGAVTDEEKIVLYKNALGLFFATLYEGFGLPVLEAQRAGIPVITSNASSLPEVSGGGAILVDPESQSEMTEALLRIYRDKAFCGELIEKGLENVKRFSWSSCANSIRDALESK